MDSTAVLTPLWELITAVAGQLGTGAVVFIVGLHYKWWVMAGQYQALKEEKDRYASLAELNGKVADNGLELAKR